MKTFNNHFFILHSVKDFMFQFIGVVFVTIPLIVSGCSNTANQAPTSATEDSSVNSRDTEASASQDDFSMSSPPDEISSGDSFATKITSFRDWNALTLWIASGKNCSDQKVKFELKHKDGSVLVVNVAGFPDGTFYLCASVEFADGSVKAPKGFPKVIKVISAKPGSFSIASIPTWITESAPTVSWSESPRATSYDVFVSGDSECLKPIQTFLSIKETSKKLNPLADGTHYLCVFASDTFGNRISAKNNGAKLAIDTNAPLVFGIAGFRNPGQGTSRTISWRQSEGSTKYHLKIGKTYNGDSCSGELIEEEMTATLKLLENLQDDSYFACLSAIDDAGNIRKADPYPYSFTVDNRPPNEFQIEGIALKSYGGPLYRVDDPTKLNQSGFKIIVGSNTDIARYKYYLRATSDCGLPLGEVGSYSVLPETEYSGFGPYINAAATSDGERFVCVEGFDLAGNSVMSSNSIKINVDTVPPEGFSIIDPVFLRNIVVGDEFDVKLSPSVGALTYSASQKPVSNVCGGAGLGLIQQSTDGNSNIVMRFKALTPGYFQVNPMAHDRANNSVYANFGFTVTIKNPVEPLPTDPLGPPDPKSLNVSNTSAEVYWEKADGGPQSFKISTTVNGSDPTPGCAKGSITTGLRAILGGQFYNIGLQVWEGDFFKHSAWHRVRVCSFDQTTGKTSPGIVTEFQYPCRNGIFSCENNGRGYNYCACQAVGAKGSILASLCYR